MSGQGLIRIPPRIYQAQADLLGVGEVRESEAVELAVVSDLEGSRVRDFGNYLLLVDRFYGRLDRKGLRSYAQRPSDQLSVSETRIGSVEVVVASGPEILSRENLVFLWTLLVGLGSAAVAISHIAKNYAGVFQAVEQGRLAREQRRELQRRVRRSTGEEVRVVRREMREFLSGHPRFKDLSSHRRAELARHLADAYLADADRVRSVREFAVERVRQIKLRIDGKDVA